MDNQARTKTKSRKPPTRPELEPISYEEIMGNAGMSGFVSFLDAPKAEADPERPLEPIAPDTVRNSTTVQDSDTVQQIGPVKPFPTVKPEHTVQAKDTVPQSKSRTVQESHAVAEQASVSKTYTVQAYPIRETRRSRIRRAYAVEDGHSLAEQEVYRTLWKAGVPESDDPDASRVIRIGYDRLAGMVRLSWVTVKANLRSLEKKLSIEVLAAEDSAHREGKQYRVYSNAAILARRESAGLLWVRRTRGVELLNTHTP